MKKLLLLISLLIVSGCTTTAPAEDWAGYPEIPGVGGFTVTGPLFPHITINLDGGQKIIMKAKNAKNAAPYINSMNLNGTSFEQTWLSLKQLTEKPKTTIDFVMSTEPNESWASDYRPPSFEPKQ